MLNLSLPTALSVAAVFTLAASIGQAYTHRWETLFANRLWVNHFILQNPQTKLIYCFHSLLGIGMGAKSSGTSIMRLIRPFFATFHVINLRRGFWCREYPATEELIRNTVVPVYLSEISPARLRGTFK